MKIIVSSSKKMTDNLKNSCDWKINPLSQSVKENLEELSIEDLKEILKIDGNLAQEVYSKIGNFKEDRSNQARLVYDGLAFKKMELDKITLEEEFYLQDKLLILSALYGPISPFEYIKPYRLDFNSKLKIKGKTLKTYWKDYYNSTISQGDTVVNLASSEFSSLFIQNRYNWLDFDFLEKHGDKLKSHSTISKKARGLMVKFMYKNKIENIEEIKDFYYENYYFSKTLSTDSKYTFIRKINV